MHKQQGTVNGPPQLESSVVRTDFNMPNTEAVDIIQTARLVSRLRSRSLTESTRQITPPTKNGHAPPPIESRNSSRSVNPSHVLTW